MVHISDEEDPERDKKMRGLTGTFQKSLQQRKRMVGLIQRLCNQLTVFKFTVYPNFEKSHKDEFQLSAAEKSTIILREDVSDFRNWWKGNVSDRYSLLSSKENKVVPFTATRPDEELDSSNYHQEMLEKAGITNARIIVEEISDDPLEPYAEISDNLRENKLSL
jgi:hypothetical protein